MKTERIQELLMYYLTSKKTVESVLDSELSIERKESAKIALGIFSDTIDALKILLNETEFVSLENNSGDDSGELA
jgi:hypothetical protein